MEKINKIIIGLELAIIALPITLTLIIYGITVSIFQLAERLNAVNIVMGLIILISLAATVSVWLLAIKYIKSSTLLNKKHVIYWLFILTGTLIVLVSFVIRYLYSPQPAKGTDEWWFYTYSSMFIGGAPLLIPAFHVFVLAFVNEKR